MVPPWWVSLEEKCRALLAMGSTDLRGQCQARNVSDRRIRQTDVERLPITGQGLPWVGVSLLSLGSRCSSSGIGGPGAPGRRLEGASVRTELEGAQG